MLCTCMEQVRIGYPQKRRFFWASLRDIMLEGDRARELLQQALALHHILLCRFPTFRLKQWLQLSGL